MQHARKKIERSKKWVINIENNEQWRSKDIKWIKNEAINTREEQ